MPNSDAIIALSKGKALIEKGWTKGRYQRKTWFGLGQPKYCAIGALRTASDDFSSSYRTFHDSYMALVESAKKSWGTTNIEGLNDRDATTKQDILNLYDEAIQSLLPTPPSQGE